MERREVAGSDGLLYCSVCGEAVERKLQLPRLDGTGSKSDVKVRMMCSCMKKEMEERTERLKREEDMRTMKSLRRISLMDERLTGANLSTFTVTEENEKLARIVRNYILNFDMMYSENRGLLLWGPVGTGKSYAAAVIANELLQRMVPVVMTSFVKLLKDAGSFDEERSNTEKLNGAKLLVIDDLGSERGTDYALERVYDIIDSRYRSNKPIILTTNMTMEQMKECRDIRYSRIYDRIFEMCYPVKVSGMSWRKKEAAARYAETRNILEG